MDTNDDIQRTLGLLQGQLGAHEGRTQRLEHNVNEMRAELTGKVDQILLYMERQKGHINANRRAAGLIGGAVSVLISAVGVVVAWVTAKHS